MKINIEHTEISLDEIGYSIGFALMILGLFLSGMVLLLGIAVVVLSLWLPDFVVLEFGTPEEDEE